MASDWKSGDRLLIREASENDVQSAYEMMTSLGYPNLPRNEFAGIFLAVLAGENSQVLLAVEATGRTLGLMSISLRPQLRLAGTILCIDELAVIAEARGAGVGRALLSEAKKIAQEQKAQRIELHTNRARESYRRNFYVKSGFTEADSALMRMDLIGS